MLRDNTYKPNYTNFMLYLMPTIRHVKHCVRKTTACLGNVQKKFSGWQDLNKGTRLKSGIATTILYLHSHNLTADIRHQLQAPSIYFENDVKKPEIAHCSLKGSSHLPFSPEFVEPVTMARPQQVRVSHKHRVQGLGIRLECNLNRLA